MQILEITIAELPHFVQSELWQQLQPKPLTPPRAISQSLNPRAQPDDVALIIAWEDKILLGLAGILPNFIHGQAAEKAASNTCWWADAQKGRQIAFPLLMKAFALCQERMFMTDLTPHTLSILEKTNRFDFPPVSPGIRGFLKFNLHEILPARVPSLRKFKPLLNLSDLSLNILFVPFYWLNRARFISKSLKVEYLSTLNNELYAFIESHSQNEFIRRSGKELEWIVQYPWIKPKNKEEALSSMEYPFSHLVDSFEQYFLRISACGKTIGLLMISLRDGHMKVPYAYFEEKDAPLILLVIYRQAVLKKAVTLTLFLPALVKVMRSAAHPFIFRKRIKRLVAFSKQLTHLYLRYPKLQDGDGDVVFT